MSGTPDSSGTATRGFSSPLRRMRERDIDEAHRASTPLELLFDLAFVVAIAAASAHLHHDIVDHHVWRGLQGFSISMFAIWWAWMNYTWFASAYDTDDIPFRVLTMVQMGGAVLLAVGIAQFEGSMNGAIITGYVVMRMALVVQWLRAAHGSERYARQCVRYAIGITVMQAVWIAIAFTEPQLQQWLIPFAILGEILVPPWAERGDMTPWHPHHIAERYGLLVIIVLGEGVLGLSQALNVAIIEAGWTVALGVVGPAALIIVFGFWWVYFLAPYGHALQQRRHRSYVWGYLHYGIFASLAAMGAGLAVAAEALQHPEEISTVRVAWSIAIPMIVFLVTKYVIHAALWGRDARYDVLQIVPTGLLALAVGAAYAGASVAWTLALLTLVPVALVCVVEYVQHRGAGGWRMTS